MITTTVEGRRCCCFADIVVTTYYIYSVLLPSSSSLSAAAILLRSVCRLDGVQSRQRVTAERAIVPPPRRTSADVGQPGARTALSRVTRYQCLRNIEQERRVTVTVESRLAVVRGPAQSTRRCVKFQVHDAMT